jgi:hypothetical protein
MNGRRGKYHSVQCMRFKLSNVPHSFLAEIIALSERKNRIKYRRAEIHCRRIVLRLLSAAGSKVTNLSTVFCLSKQLNCEPSAVLRFSGTVAVGRIIYVVISIPWSHPSFPRILF